MRFVSAIVIVLVSVTISLADPPTLEIQAEIPATGQYVSFTPKTDAKSVMYIGLSGVDPFPSELLKDSRSFLLPASGLKTGYYKFVAIAIKDNESTRRDFVIKVGNPTPGPIVPEPKPDDPPQPTPKEDAPVATAGLYVAFINESGNRVTQSQFNVMYGATTAKWLDTNCVKVGNNAQWRIIDQNNLPANDPWKAIVTRKRSSIPWVVVIFDKKYVMEGALPATGTEEDFLNSIVKAIPKSARQKSSAETKVNPLLPLLQEGEEGNLSVEDTTVDTTVLTVDNWKSTLADGRVTNAQTTVKVENIGTPVDMKTVQTNTMYTLTGGTNSNTCANGNCPTGPQYKQRWYPGKLLGW